MNMAREVEVFLARHDAVLAPRVKREVKKKLETGRKSGGRGAKLTPR